MITHPTDSLVLSGQVVRYLSLRYLLPPQHKGSTFLFKVFKCGTLLCKAFIGRIVCILDTEMLSFRQRHQIQKCLLYYCIIGFLRAWMLFFVVLCVWTSPQSWISLIFLHSSGRDYSCVCFVHTNPSPGIGQPRISTLIQILPLGNHERGLTRMYRPITGAGKMFWTGISFSLLPMKIY